MVSSDEKTGIQALERKHRTLAPRPGHDEKIEFEYTRHGTLCLIANWDVAKGRFREARIGPTRTEADFVAHIETTVNTDPDAGWVFVVDQLNTHMSEGLHCSWLNQVEIWFSILTRRLLKRSSFCSLEDLRDRLVAFIRYFNDVPGKPFKWTYTGRPLQA